MVPEMYILHGWSVSDSNEAKWDAFRAALAQKAVPTHFLPIPGLSAPLDEVWGLNDFSRWLETQLPSSPVWLLGHSFGGQVLVRFAAQHPERVAGVILIDSAGIRDHRMLPTLKRAGFLVAAKLGKLLFQFDVLRTVLYTLARERDYHNAPPLLRRTMSKILDDEVTADLPKITAPTLILWGEEDRVTPLHLAQQFVAGIRGSELTVITGARHSPQFTHSVETAAAVVRFLQRFAKDSHGK